MPDPLTAPKIAHPPIVAIARPPRRWPTRVATKPYKACDSPAWPAKTPIAMKSGTIDSEYGKTASKVARPSMKPDVSAPAVSVRPT